MPSIKRIRRLLQLVELLQFGRSYNSHQLAELCGVSRRTIFRDVRTLQQSGLHILYDERRQGYALSDPLFLPPTDLTLEETLSLLVLCHELGNTERGVPFQRSARAAAQKLLSNLPRRLRDWVGELSGNIAIRLEPHNPLDESQPYYDLLTQALSERRQMRVSYHSLTDGQVIQTRLSPYRMLFNRRSWYVIGRSSLHRAVRTLNLGRIQKAELLETRFQIPPRFSLERHFGNAWNLIRQRGQRQRVTVRFQPMVAHNVAEVRWHKTQRITWNDDGTMDFQVTVDGLREIIWWILGYGDQAEVLEPPELRREILRHAETLRETYHR